MVAADHPLLLLQQRSLPSSSSSSHLHLVAASPPQLLQPPLLLVPPLELSHEPRHHELQLLLSLPNSRRASPPRTPTPPEPAQPPSSHHHEDQLRLVDPDPSQAPPPTTPSTPSPTSPDHALLRLHHTAACPPLSCQPPRRPPRPPRPHLRLTCQCLLITVPTPLQNPTRTPPLVAADPHHENDHLPASRPPPSANPSHHQTQHSPTSTLRRPPDTSTSPSLHLIDNHLLHAPISLFAIRSPTPCPASSPSTRPTT